MRNKNLCGNDWSLIFVSNEQLKKDGVTNELAELERRGYEKVPAVVPGNLELDLMRAGKLDDPYYGDNFYDRKCEYLHAYYTKEFEYSDDYENPVLYFEGLDTVADLFLNGEKIGSADNMLIPHEFAVGGVLKKGKNVLTVHITPAVIKAREYPLTLNDGAYRYNNESLYLRRAPHTYGWDIMPRIVSAGIWRPVRLEERKEDRITEFFGYTVSLDRKTNEAKLYFLYNTVLSADDISRYALSVTGECGDSRFETKTKLYHTGGHIDLDVRDAKFWWPRNAGEPHLYNVKVTLYKDGEETDVYTTRLGIRTVELIRTGTTNEKGEGEFCFEINGKKVFCMGTNWVPADALHSQDARRIPAMLPMLTDTGCNIIRIWGGGVYENDLVYDYCDENGILIWQDFIMGCAVYPQDEDFLAKMRTEVTVAVKRLRQHPALILWAGDNEDDSAYLGWFGKRRDPNQNRLTREVIPQVLGMHDFSRPYLPSSPYIDEETFRTDGNPSEDHLWGPRDYFKGNFYSTSVAHFASETGYHGCPSPASLKRYIPEEYLWTVTDADGWKDIENNRMWIAHATAMENEPDAPYFYRIRLMADQVTTLFGNTVPCTLSDFAKASQISQAEAKKYFIERFRISKWRRTGIIWWNLVDGCPQISDAVVDYYFVKKLAYNYIRRSQTPLCLMFDEPEADGTKIALHAVNDTPTDSEISYRVTDLTVGKTVSEGSAIAKADASVILDTVGIEKGEKHFYFIEWTQDGVRHTNHYMTNICAIDYATYMGYLEKCGYDAFEGF